ncbi:hypothetical protein AB0E88_03235 [Streptomyces sp. NPDC028635]|uniref:hypothetical protein n=1 Tax=Streptomyces sp. NPDC028635 TaxID=3154800 RepID=UPI0033C12399
MVGVGRRAAGVGVRRGVVVAAALMVVTGVAGGDRAQAWAQGRGLDARGGGEIGSEHVRVGGEYWVSMPLPDSVSAEPLTVVRARWLHVPRGLRVLRYGVTDADHDGICMLGVGDDAAFALAARDVRALDERPVRVPAHGRAGACLLARVEVTAPVHDNLAGYRVWYRQGAVVYRQDVAREAGLRLRPEEE